MLVFRACTCRTSLARWKVPSAGVRVPARSRGRRGCRRAAISSSKCFGPSSSAARTEANAPVGVRRAARERSVSMPPRPNGQVRSKPALAPMRLPVERRIERQRAHAVSSTTMSRSAWKRVASAQSICCVGEDVDVGIDDEHVLHVGEASRTRRAIALRASPGTRWRICDAHVELAAARGASRRPRPVRAPRSRARARPSTSVRSAPSCAVSVWPCVAGR